MTKEEQKLAATRKNIIEIFRLQTKEGQQELKELIEAHKIMYPSDNFYDAIDTYIWLLETEIEYFTRHENLR